MSQMLLKSQYQQFMDNDITEICPTIYYGTVNSLKQEIFHNYNFKIIINCLPTYKFLKHLNKSNISIPTDMLMLLLDLNFDINKFNDDEKALLNEFDMKFNKILQNFINYFINYNENIDKIINKLPNNLNLNISNPILSGNLKNNLFKLTRLIKLFKIMNNSIDILIIGDNNENFSKSLLISYLMDNYNYNVNNSINYLHYKINVNFNLNYYEDLLILENLKKFYVENNEIKIGSSILYNNKQGKRCREDEDYSEKRIRF